MSKFITEFNEFAMRGNVLDMAVGVVIGAAFGKIVSSLVDDLIMPLVGVAYRGMNFTDYKWVIQSAVMNGTEVIKPEVTLNWGTWGSDRCQLHNNSVLHIRYDKVCQQAEPQESGRAGTGRVRTDQRGGAAHRNTRPAEGPQTGIGFAHPFYRNQPESRPHSSVRHFVT